MAQLKGTPISENGVLARLGGDIGFYYFGSHQNLALGRDALAETSAFLLDAGLAKTPLFMWTYSNSELLVFCIL